MTGPRSLARADFLDEYHWKLFYLHVEEQRVIIAVATFLLRLTAVDNCEGAVVKVCKKPRDIAHVISIEGAPHTRERHGYETVAYVSEIKVEITIWASSCVSICTFVLVKQVKLSTWVPKTSSILTNRSLQFTSKCFLQAQ